MSGPATTMEDLARMGVKKDDVAQRLKDVFRWGDDGEITSLDLNRERSNPWWGYEDVGKPPKAFNYLVSNWVIDHIEEPKITTREYTETYANFDGLEPVARTYHRSHTITVSRDYTLTNDWNVSVNAQIPLGEGGAAIGFGAGMSQQDVKHSSTQESETRDVTDNFNVPAGKGIKITETAKMIEQTVVYRAKIGVQGYIGVIRDPGFFDRYEYYGGDASLVCPDAGVTNYIRCKDVNWEYSVAKTTLTAPDVSGGVTSFTTMAAFRSPSTGPMLMPQASSVAPDVRLALFKPTKKSASEGDTIRAMFVPNKTADITLHFGSDPPVNVGNRGLVVGQFASKILGTANLWVTTHNLPPNTQLVSRPTVLYTPGSADAHVSFRYDSNVINFTGLQTLIHTASQTMVWGGQVSATVH